MIATPSALGRSGKTETVNVTDRMSAEAAADMARLRVRSAIKDVGPVWVSAGLSGGHDSVTATYVASLAAGFCSAFHIDTGVGLKATEDYVAAICQNQRWTLEVFKAMENTQGNGKPDPMDYFALIEKHGFPGPGQHRTMYIKLKERAIRRWVRAHKKKHSRQVLLLVSGARRQESARRSSVNASDVTDGRWDDSLPVYWCNPLWDFSKLDCTRIMEHAKLPRSPDTEAAMIAQAVKAIRELRKPGPFCRDCADNDGTCPGTGRPCDPDEAIARACFASAGLVEKVTPHRRSHD